MHKTHLAYALIDITAIISVVMCKVDIISLQLEIFTALKDKTYSRNAKYKARLNILSNLLV